MRQEKTENDVVIESDRGENCETLMASVEVKL